MKLLSIILALLFIVPATLPANSQENSAAGTEKSVKEKATYVYYFHSSRRCKTCLSIERIARGIVKDQYGDNKNVVFKSLNIEDDKNQALVEKYQIAGSSLLVCCGKENVNLTAKAFQYALSSPDKLQDALIAAVEKMLK
jgi:hypothetical protein